MIVVSIDPGVRACGVAVWMDGNLLAAAHVKSRCKEDDSLAWDAMARAVVRYVDTTLFAIGADRLAPPDHLVIEFPQTYGGRSAKGDTNDLLQLAAVVSAICTRFGSITIWRPREWKGSVPKEVTARRVDARLSAAEKSRIHWPAPSLRHNVYDAIAIGQRFFDRAILR